MKSAAIVIALTLTIATLSGFAQNTNNPPPAGGGPGRGFHILPPHAQDQLSLTADQQKQLSELEAEVKGKIEAILTPAQMEKLKKMRPPQRQGDTGGEGQANHQPPAGE
jgi:Spy/CpxP family protein refolding chaperone